MNGIQFNPFRNEERDYNRKKSDAEALLAHKIQEGTVKVGSDEWRKRCEAIEYFDSMASKLNERYNDNS